jgi:hypothetical protein
MTRLVALDVVICATCKELVLFVLCAEIAVNDLWVCVR